MARKIRKQPIYENSEETKQTILTVAQQLFMKYGYRAVTTRQLARACGLTQPALYHHFKGKQELYLAVVTTEIAKIKVGIERIARRSEPVPECLRSVASFILDRIQYDLGLMLHDVRYEVTPDARILLDNQFHSGFIIPIATIFEAGIQQGLLLDAEHGGIAPLLGAYLFMNMLSRFATQRREEISALTQRSSTANSADLIVRVLLHGLVRPNSS